MYVYCNVCVLVIEWRHPSIIHLIFRWLSISEAHEERSLTDRRSAACHVWLDYPKYPVTYEHTSVCIWPWIRSRG
jgi:hypothetical protein